MSFKDTKLDVPLSVNLARDNLLMETYCLFLIHVEKMPLLFLVMKNDEDYS